MGALGYGGDKAIFRAGRVGTTRQLMSNLVSSSGSVASDTTGVGTAVIFAKGASYGGDKGIFAFGSITDGEGTKVSTSNLVSNTGVVAANVTGVGTGREGAAACGYGGDKAIFGFGNVASNLGMTNLVNNSGVVASDVSAVGTARTGLAAAGFSYAT